MEFLLIIAHDDAFRPDDALIAEIQRWGASVRERGVHRDGRPLQPHATAKTVRIRDDRTSVEDGPFSAAVEKICAYELIDCADIDEALAIAAEHPMARAATVEVRPVWSDLIG